jgi:hypothetical protein
LFNAHRGTLTARNLNTGARFEVRIGPRRLTNTHFSTTDQPAHTALTTSKFRTKPAQRMEAGKRDHAERMPAAYPRAREAAHGYQQQRDVAYRQRVTWRMAAVKLVRPLRRQKGSLHMLWSAVSVSRVDWHGGSRRTSE